MDLFFPGQRLKALRQAAGFKNALDFTNAVGLTYQTYSAHERHPQGREIRADVAEEYAAIFKGEKKLKNALPANCQLDIDVTGQWIRYGETPTSPTPQILKSLSAEIVAFPDTKEIFSETSTTFNRDILKQVIERLFESSPRLDFPAEKFNDLLEYYHDRIIETQRRSSDEAIVIELNLIRKID